MKSPIFPLILNSPDILSLLESTQYPNLIMILKSTPPTQKKPLTGLSQAEDQSCSSQEQLQCRCTQLPAFSSIWNGQLNSFQTFCPFLFCIICPTWRGCWKTPCQLMRRLQCLLLPPWQKENLKQVKPTRTLLMLSLIRFFSRISHIIFLAYNKLLWLCQTPLGQLCPIPSSVHLLLQS